GFLRSQSIISTFFLSIAAKFTARFVVVIVFPSFLVELVTNIVFNFLSKFEYCMLVLIFLYCSAITDFGSLYDKMLFIYYLQLNLFLFSKYFFLFSYFKV